MSLKDQFRYYKSDQDSGVTLLDASISKFKYKRHSHDDFSIGVTMSGYQSFYCTGERFRVPRGGIIQINSNETHDGFAEDMEGYRYYMLYIPRKLLYDGFQAHTNEKRREFQFKETVVDHPKLRHQLLQFIHLLQCKQSDSMQMEELYLRVLDTLLDVNSPFKKLSIQRGSRDSLIDRAMEYIHDHVYDNIGLDELSDLLHVSKYHFVRLFKQHTGQSPYQYFLNRKLNAARRELHMGKEIIDVVDRIGFYDVSHFNRRFKEVYGTTPHEFKNDIHK